MIFANVLASEFIKLRRSNVRWLSLAAISMGPVGLALFMWILREPGRAAQLGLIGTKANLSGLTATWPGYVAMMPLFVGIGGMLLLAFIVAYVFGREYTEGTAKNLLALPVGRHWFVLAKFVVIAIWWTVLVIAVLSETFIIGFLLKLPGFSEGLAIKTVRISIITAVIAYMLAPMIAWITTLGRGYMPPLGFMLTMLLLGNLFSKTGWGPWFPWSILPLFIGAVGQRVQTLPTGSLVVMALTFFAGVAATIAQLRYADNTQ